MKRNYLIIVLSLLLVQTGFAQGKLADLFGKLYGKENVTQVTISKSMLNMMPSMNVSANIEGVNIKNILVKLNQIDIFTSEDADMKKLMVKETKKYLDGNKAYEVLMRVKDGKSDVVFYGEKDDNLFSSLIMVVNKETNCTLIRMSGKFTPQDIQDITKKETEK